MTDCHGVNVGRDDDLVIDRTFACPHSEAEILRQFRAEQGRQLANERDDLIAQGADPADLTIPIHPDDQEEA